LFCYVFDFLSIFLLFLFWPYFVKWYSSIHKFLDFQMWRMANFVKISSWLSNTFFFWKEQTFLFIAEKISSLQTRHSGKKSGNITNILKGLPFPTQSNTHLQKDNDEIYSCQSCTAVFSDQFSFRRHVSENHSEQMPYICRLCGKGYFSYQGYWSHMHRHEGIVFSCSLCGKPFTKKNNLNRHMLQIHGVRKEKLWNLSQLDPWKHHINQ